MTLPKRLFGDPLEVLIRAEEETCRGCRFMRTDGDGTARCTNPRRTEVLAEKRCVEYEERI